MAVKQLTVKQQAYCNYMFIAGSETYGNGTQSSRKAGYKGSNSVLNNTSLDNLLKPAIITEKRRIEAKTAEKLNVDRDYLIKQTKDILEHSTSDRNKLTALSLMGDFVGAKKDNAPNAERDQAKRAAMSEEEQEIARIAAEIRVRRASKVIKIA